MKNDQIKVEANDVIARYRARVDELEFSNTVLQLQVKSLQKQLGDKQNPVEPAQPTDPTQPSGNAEIDNAETED